MGRGELARLPCVERSFAAHTGLHLLPGQVGEILGYSCAFDQRVSDVDIELERDGKFVVHQAGRDEDALRIAEIQVAMANRIVAEGNVVAVGNYGVLALGHGERHEVVRLTAQRGGDRHWHRGNHAVEIVLSNGNLARAGVTDAIGRL